MSILLQEQYMEMVLDKEYFAINTQDVHKIIKMQTLEVYEGKSGGGSNIKGVIYLRDKAIPIISMHSLFGMQETEYTQATRIILHKDCMDLVGFIVDQVNKTSIYDDIKQVSDQVSSIKKDYLKGITFREGTIVRILNMASIILGT